LLAAASESQAAPVGLLAAGSLRAALGEIAEAFREAAGIAVSPRFAASGLLKDRLAAGEASDVFASANMEHPQALARSGLAGPAMLFARNELAAFVRQDVAATGETLLDAMLDPDVKLGTSTPSADPSGDYALAVFARAEAVRPGAGAVLEAKALKLTGGPDCLPAPDGLNVYGHKLASGAADIFLAYRTNAPVIAREQPGIRMVALPAELAVGAEYGLTVLNGASPNGYRLAMFILSPEGQAILMRHGFAAPGLPLAD